MIFDEDIIVEEQPPDEFFDNPRYERVKYFLSQIR